MSNHTERKATRKHRGTANPEYAQAMRELRRSGAAGTHDARPNRERTRGTARRAAIERERY